MTDLGDLDPVQRALLEQETRREIFGLVRRCPGLNKNQIADWVGVDHRTVDDHVRLLEWAELVVVWPGESDGARCCFAAEDAGLWEDVDKRVLYGQGPVR